jgi:hypothetical protein
MRTNRKPCRDRWLGSTSSSHMHLEQRRNTPLHIVTRGGSIVINLYPSFTDKSLVICRVTDHKHLTTFNRNSKCNQRSGGYALVSSYAGCMVRARSMSVTIASS